MIDSHRQRPLSLDLCPNPDLSPRQTHSLGDPFCSLKSKNMLILRLSNNSYKLIKSHIESKAFLTHFN